MVFLLPRLPAVTGESLVQRYLSERLGGQYDFDPSNLPETVRYAATGGSRVSQAQLRSLREKIFLVAKNNGMGTARKSESIAHFDTEMAILLSQDPLFSSGEALRDDVWTFVGTSMAPDIVHWRFGTSLKRYLGGARNTFQRLWMRGKIFDRGEDHKERWLLIKELTEDASVQITERPSLGGDPVLARAIAEAWLRASLRHGRNRMEPVMRWAVLRIRIWNEIRSLADLPCGQLAGILDNAFDTAARHHAPDLGKVKERITKKNQKSKDGAAVRLRA